MHITKSFYLLGLVASAQACAFAGMASSVEGDVQIPDGHIEVKRSENDNLQPRSGLCPAVWTKVASTLAADFVSNHQCTEDARGAIRLAFHDCFSGAGCDGSLILAKEYEREENDPLADIAVKIGAWATEFNVSTADMIQFAGAQATLSCPQGPRIRVLVGRTDSATAAPEGELPTATDSASSLISQFAAKGFSTTDLVALIGAHSTAKQFVTIAATAGQGLDSTPGVWDTLYYSQTLKKTAPNSLVSDLNLAQDSRTKGAFRNFESNARWAPAFVTAMNKMSVLGNSVNTLTDCSSALRSGTAKRDIRAQAIGESRGLF